MAWGGGPDWVPDSNAYQVGGSVAGGGYNLGTAEGIIRVNYDGSGAKQAQSDFSNVEKSATRSGEGMRRAGIATTAAGVALAGGLVLAIKVAADFETQISAIGAVSGATGEDLDAVRRKALQLGADTSFSASEAAGAIEELAKAGISLPDILNGAADAAVSLAAAGGIALPEAATIAANAMNAFGIAARDLPHVADLIAGAANASAIDVSQFGQSLQQSGAVAHLAGISFDDLAVAIAEMGNAGIKGSDAGTSLKTFLQNLNPVTKQQVELFDKLGITTNGMGNKFFDASGKARSLADISQVLQDALKGQTQQQKLATLETLFGSDAIRAAAILSENGATGFNNLATAMGKVSAADVAKARLDNLNGSIEQLKGSVETVAIRFGETLQAPLRQVAELFTQVANTISRLPDSVLSTIGVVVALAAGFLILVGSLTAIAGTLALIDFALVFNPVTLAVVGAVAALILVGVWLRNAWEQSQTFRDTVVGAFNAIRDAYNSNVAPALQALGTVWATTIQPAIAQLADFIQGRLLVAVEGVVSAFRDRIGPAMQTAQQIIQGQVIPTIQQLAQWWDANKAAIEPVIGAIIRLIGFLAAAGIVQAIAVVIFSLQTMAAGFQIAVTAIEFATGAIRTIIGVILGIGAIIQGAASAIAGFWLTLVGIVSGAVQSVVNFFVALPGQILAAIQALPGLLIGFFTNALNTVAFAVGFAIGSIVGFFIALPGRIVGAIQAIPGLVSNVFNNARNTAVSVATGLVNSVVGFLASLPGRASAAISGIIGAVSGILHSAGSAAGSAAGSIVSSVISTISSLPGRVASFAGSMFSAGADLIRGALNGVLSAVGGLVSAARDAAGRAVAGFKAALHIGSPSRVTRDEVGVPVIEGIIEGVESRRRALVDALGSLAMTAIVNPTRNVLGLDGVGGVGAGTTGTEAKGTSLTVNQTVNALPGMDVQDVANEANRKLAFAVKTGTAGV
jgi:TP901 family phage tail tape measure protein